MGKASFLGSVLLGVRHGNGFHNGLSDEIRQVPYGSWVVGYLRSDSISGTRRKKGGLLYLMHERPGRAVLQVGHLVVHLGIDLSVRGVV